VYCTGLRASRGLCVWWVPQQNWVVVSGSAECGVGSWVVVVVVWGGGAFGAAEGIALGGTLWLDRA
jgi:hypothetical protein